MVLAPLKSSKRSDSNYFLTLSKQIDDYRQQFLTLAATP
jgi:hypothetical protein